MTAEWKGDTGRGVLVVVAIWCCVFVWAVCTTIFQDHTQARANLKGARAEITSLKQNAGTAATGSQQEISKLQSTISNRDTEIAGLKNQIQNQQATINSTLLELGRSQQQEIQPLRITPHYLGIVSIRLPASVAGAQAFGSWLLLTNKTVTPIRVLVKCNIDVVAASGWVLGTGGMTSGGWGGRVTESLQEYGVGILSPAWTPNTPLLVTVHAKSQSQNQNARCSFTQM